MTQSRNIFLSLVASLLIAAVAFAASEEKLDHDNSILSVFVQPSISFLSFTEREYFQNAIDTIYYGFKADADSFAVNRAESLSVAKQDFQKVNFCFPITAGIQWQFTEDHFLSAGIGFIYDNESVVLTDYKSNTHSYEYTLQGVPLFLEYRFALPKNFITLSTGGLFSISVRWYWVLPGTEIYTSWGYLGAETPLLGAGFGVSLGYLFASWKNFKLYGDIGFSSISVKSNKKFADIVDGGPDEKAKWNLGGLQMQIRGTFGFWNKPKPKDDDDDDDNVDDNPKKRKKKSVKILADTLNADSLKAVADSSATPDTAKVDSASVAADSAKIAADSANVANTAKAAKVADSTKANVADSTAKPALLKASSAIDTAKKDTTKNIADSLKKNIADSQTKNVAADTAAIKTIAADTAKARIADSASAAKDSVTKNAKSVADSSKANTATPTPAKQPENPPVKNAEPASDKSKGD